MAVQVFSLSKDGSKKLSGNLRVAEFARYDNRSLAAKYCGDEVKIDLDLVTFLQKIRDHFAAPLIITSGYRPTGYNAGIGGEPGSYHTFGQAADFYVQNVPANQVAAYAETLGAKGVGLYTAQKFIHLDTRAAKYFWKNDGGGNVTVSTHGGKVTKAESKNPSADWSAYIKSVQSAVGAAVDGIAGKRTLAACPTLQPGSIHKVLIPVQHRLRYIGHDCGSADGIFGPKTAAAVKAFQKANGLSADGIIGKNTWKRLLGIA